MKSTYYVAGIAGCLLLAGCTTLGEQISQWEADGVITPETAEAMRASVNDGWAWLKDAGLVLLSAAAAWAGIRLPPGMIPGVSRGASTQVLLKKHELPIPATPPVAS